MAVRVRRVCPCMTYKSLTGGGVTGFATWYCTQSVPNCLPIGSTAPLKGDNREYLYFIFNRCVKNQSLADDWK